MKPNHIHSTPSPYNSGHALSPKPHPLCSGPSALHQLL